MSSVKLNHALGGSTTLEAGDTASAETITLPAGNKTLLATDGDGSQLTGVGVDGIVSTANATAITIDSNENVGIGVTPESWSGAEQALQIGDSTAIWQYSTGGSGASYFNNNAYYNSGWKYLNTNKATMMYCGGGEVQFHVAPSGTADSALSWTTALEITNDGRGLSQFTAKAWVNFNGTGTVSIRDSHNVSSITDNGTGQYRINFSNNLANEDYSVVGMSDGVYNGNVMSLGHGDSDTSYMWTNQFEFEVRGGENSGGSTFDPQTCCLQVFGD